MKILHTVQNYSPAVGGMSEAVRQISERLARRGHEVHVATESHPDRAALQIGGVQIHPFAITGNAVHGYRGDWRPYQDFVQFGAFDVVTNFAAQQWATDALLPILPTIPSCKVFVPTGFSGLYWPEFQDYFQRMPEWMRQYDLIVFLSRRYRDAEFADTHGIKNFTVIPNGAAEEEFYREGLPDIRAELKIPDKDFLIVHVGSHTGLKGHREAISIFSRARLGRATFLLVGDPANQDCLHSCQRRQRLFECDPRQWGRGKRLLLARLDRDRTVAALKEADLFLFPSQVECSPLVLFEALAARTPFLSTEVGNASEIVEVTGGGQLLPTRHFRDGLSRADVRQGAACLEELLVNRERRQLMAERGHAVWKKQFTWEHIAELYEQAYRDLLQSATGRGGQ